MTAPFASGRKSIAECDRCGFTVKLKTLKAEVVKQKTTGLLVCQDCWTKDHPQLMLGTVPVNDPQALRNPRPLALVESRDIQWGWNPVGGGNTSINPGTPDTLLMRGEVGTVTVSVT
jgi:hypothetical protein